MKSQTFYENETVKFGGSNSRITEEQAEAFYKLKNLPKGCLTVEPNHIKFGNFCGVLCANDVTIELLPKIEYSDETDIKHSYDLFVKMLCATGELGLKQISAANLLNQHIRLLDIFILDFCSEIQQAVRGGVIAQYAEHEENLHTVRGRLHLTEHLRHNAFDKSRIFCRFDEYTIDNSYNRILKGVLSRLLHHCLNVRAKTAVTTLLHRFDEVADQSVSVEDIDQLVFDRTNEHWERVFDKAKRLLQGLFPNVRSGKETSGTALLFNMGELFERLLGVRLRQECSSYERSSLSVKLQDSTYNLATLTEFMSDSGLREDAFGLQPDFTVFKNGNCISILDAKWKHLDTPKSKFNVSSDDAYQMAAYAGRYGCKNIALIYPASKKYKPYKKIAHYEFNSPDNVYLNDVHLSVITVNLNDLANRHGLATKSNKPSALRDFFQSF